MRILQVFDGYGIPNARALPGGAYGSVASVVYYLSKYLVLKGCDVTILERNLGTLPDEEYISGIRYCRINSRGLPVHPYKLVKSVSGITYLIKDSYIIAKKINDFILKNKKFDIIHFHFPFSSIFLVNLNSKIRNYSVYTAHVGEESKRFGLTKNTNLALKIFQPDIHLIKSIRCSIVLNRNLKYKLSAKGICSNKLVVIPNGIDVNEFKLYNSDFNCSDILGKYDIHNRILLLFVGKIIPRKGIHILVRSLDKLVNMHGCDNILLLLVGDTSLDLDFYQKLKYYINSKRLNNYIKFTKFISYDYLKILYSLCDIFVFPSFEEGDPIALKEALVSGKPLVGSNVSGIPMQIIDGWNGFLFEPGNYIQLTEKLMYLIENKNERVRMGRNSRKLAELKFSWWNIAGEYLNLYKKLVGGKSNE